MREKPVAGGFDTALDDAEALLPDDPARAQVLAVRVLKVAGEYAPALQILAAALRAQGEAAAAAAAASRAVAATLREPEIVAATEALVEHDLKRAEVLLSAYLMKRPTDAVALFLSARVEAQRGELEGAERYLILCLQMAPGYAPARAEYASILARMNRTREALSEIDRALEGGAEDPPSQLLRANCLAQVGDYHSAIDTYRDVLDAHPGYPGAWLGFGHALRTKGDQAQAVAAYRRCLEMAPHFGEAWWSLANLKTVRLTDLDVAAMERSLSAIGLSDEDRFHLQFALGKAREDSRDYAASFDHYAQAATLRRQSIDYDARETTAFVARCKAVFTEPHLGARAGVGAPQQDPIFVIGMPRAGSTLIEQILASHSQVEGTRELPDIIAMARRMDGSGGASSRYPELLADLTEADLRALGEEYLARASLYRRLDRPFFVDKMPNNWLHLGLILLALPNAKIVDARRHPLGCGFSNFKQHYAQGQYFTYDLRDIGQYYADYVDLLSHFDRLAPGRIHRVFYEDIIANPDAEISRLLTYCGLGDEVACLRFHENDRAVRTASSEQVRRPIFTEGLDHWTHFEPWLGPLKSSLGPVLDAYPGVPGEAPARMD